MRRIVLFLFLSLFSLPAFSQGMYGVEGGFGMNTSYKPYLTPTLKGYLMTRINRHLYVGGQMSIERYSFQYNSFIPLQQVEFGDILTIRQKSTYLLFAPKLDIGLGYRKYVHINLTVGGGILMGGSQWTNKYEPYWTTPGGGAFGKDTVGHNTLFNIPNLLLRYGVGISERIPTKGYWSVVLSQDFGILPQNFSNDNPILHTSYFCITAGVMHKYRQVLVEY